MSSSSQISALQKKMKDEQNTKYYVLEIIYNFFGNEVKEFDTDPNEILKLKKDAEQHLTTRHDIDWFNEIQRKDALNELDTEFMLAENALDTYKRQGKSFQIADVMLRDGLLAEMITSAANIVKLRKEINTLNPKGVTKALTDAVTFWEKKLKEDQDAKAELEKRLHSGH